MKANWRGTSLSSVEHESSEFDHNLFSKQDHDIQQPVVSIDEFGILESKEEDDGEDPPFGTE